MGEHEIGAEQAAISGMTGTVSAAREGCKLLTGMGRECLDSLELDEDHDKIVYG